MGKRKKKLTQKAIHYKQKNTLSHTHTHTPTQRRDLASIQRNTLTSYTMHAVLSSLFDIRHIVTYVRKHNKNKTREEKQHLENIDFIIQRSTMEVNMLTFLSMDPIG